jgi:hypothetical protein
MKVRSIIALFLWITYLGTPLLSLQAGTCDMACCVENQSACPMDDHEEDCVSLEAATPILVISADTSKSFKVKYYSLNPSKLEVIQDDHHVQRSLAPSDQLFPLLLRPVSTPLLI